MVDERIVKLVFDNLDFEKAVSITKVSLRELSGAIGNIGQSIDTTGIENGVRGIGKRFDATKVAFETMVRNITNRAVDAGVNITRALTIDPINTGLKEYEEKIDSIQTLVLSAKRDDGKNVTLDLVKQKLEELNKYSDDTIYNFQDMTKNITKFTNAGVGFETSVQAIQGIANVAAVSGANAENASHAMYNFAQALATGYIQRIDWKSIEVANMATDEFKQQLLDTAVALGVVNKN